MDRDFKYDVAFSFLKEDEELATKINDLIQGRISTFLYSKRQGEVAGTDGEKTFNAVFGTDARIVVVLFRQNWGTTPWTRIEETAIRNRAFDEGYDFVIFMPLDNPPASPRWLPKTQIWVGLDRWGVEGAASVIEAKIQAAGGTAHPETIEQRADRFKREIDAENARRKFLGSQEGVVVADREVQFLFGELEKVSGQISTGPNFTFQVERKAENARLYGGKCRLDIEWFRRYTNSLEDSRLTLILSRSKLGSLERVRNWTFNFDLDLSRNRGWRERTSSPFISTHDLAQFCIKMVMDEIYKDSLGDRARIV